MKTVYNARLLSLILLFCIFEGNAQTSKISYFMESAGTRSSLNPALRPTQGYVGVPILADFNLMLGTNTFNMDHFTFHKNNDFLFFMNDNVGVEEFLKNISNANYLDINTDISLLTAGWYAGNNFWNINLGVRGFAGANLPKDFFRLAKEGFGIEDKNIFDLSNTGVSAMLFGELSLGFSRTFLDNKLSIGVRGKFLTGLGNANLKVDALTLAVGSDDWVVHSDALMQISAPGLQPEYDEDGALNGFDFGEKILTSPAGYGMGWDVGVEYNLVHLSENFDGLLTNVLRRMKISAALTDIGFIKWDKNSSTTLHARGDSNIDPDNLSFSLDNDNSLADHFNEMGENLEEFVKFRPDDKQDAYETSLRTNMNFGLEYDIWENKLSAGLLSSTTFAEYYTMTELTLSANYSPFSWLTVSGAHSFAPGLFKTFGAALHIAPSKGLNLFIASDYLVPHVNSDFIPTTSKAVNVHWGITIPL
ncbi:MAG: DUF5723 family protein [Flavobacteriaceae bacterium]|jgi:hypothetical protein|nr:DUF5723 family protein [Flavobacteriaceae bacterium]